MGTKQVDYYSVLILSVFLGVTEADVALFKRAQEKANESMKIGAVNTQSPSSRLPPNIQFGSYEITTWYSSPYPQEYAR